MDEEHMSWIFVNRELNQEAIGGIATCVVILPCNGLYLRRYGLSDRSRLTNDWWLVTGTHVLRRSLSLEVEYD
jgi:hypothetical protein